MKEEIQKFFKGDAEDNEEKQPHWMLDGNTYQVIKREGQMEYLISLVKKSGKQFFEGAADGIEYIRNVKKHD